MKCTLTIMLLLASTALLKAQAPAYRPQVPLPHLNTYPTAFPFKNHNVGTGLDLYGKTYDGYIITLSGDTLRGKIKSIGDIENQSKIRFYAQPKQKTVYTPFDAKGYTLIIDNKEYEYIFFSRNPHPIFMIKWVDGPVKLYARYYQNFQGAALPYYYTQRNDGPIVEFGTFNAGIGSDNFKASASQFFSDCPEILRKITNKEYKLKDIKTVFEKYNQWLTKTTKDENKVEDSHSPDF